MFFEPTVCFIIKKVKTTLIFEREKLRQKDFFQWDIFQIVGHYDICQIHQWCKNRFYITVRLQLAQYKKISY